MKNFINLLFITVLFTVVLFSCSIDAADSADSIKSGQNIYKAVNSANEDNMISNGTFDSGMQNWEGYIREGTFGRVDIVWGSDRRASVWHYRGDDHPDPWDLELKQLGLPIIQGKTYTLSFDAWTRRATNREINIQIGLHEPPWTCYAGWDNYFELTQYNNDNPELNRYSMTFTMEHPTDYNAYLAFQCGGDSDKYCIYIDNVVLIEN